MSERNVNGAADERGVLINTMKQRILKSGIVLLAILTLMAGGAAYAAGETVYTNTRMLADNLEYINTVSWDHTEGRAESFAVVLTGKGDAYPIVMNGDTVFGGFTISNMVSYAESLGKNVLAAVNTDFFTINAVPLGVVVEDGVYKSSPGDRNAVTFSDNGNIDIIEPPTVWIALHNDGGAPGKNNAGKTINMRNFNKIRTDLGGLVLYSEAFSSVSTRASSPGWFVRFKILKGEPSVSGTMALEVAEASSCEGAVPIGEGYLVLTAADKSELAAQFEKFAVGDKVTLTTTCSDERLTNARYATGGGDILVSDGVMTDSAGWAASLMLRAPRTAFGLRDDGTVVSYIVDGRNSEHSVGLTLTELADEMLRQGCVYAVNFDGGGSTALSVRIPGNNKETVVNRPSDGSERICSTCLLFVTDAEPNGKPRNLSLRNDGTIVLAESSVDLVFTATDRGYKPVSTPGDIAASAMTPGAMIKGKQYTAGGIAGTDRISLYSPSTGASGFGEIYVITRPTSITLRKIGSAAPLTSVILTRGMTLELDVTATYYRREVVAQAGSFTYTVSGDIGEMTSPGVFTAGQEIGETGTIVVSAGGRSAELKVVVGGFDDMQEHWAKEYAEYLYMARISDGVADAQFGPSLLMKRCDYILMLHRAAGRPEPVDSANFDDVPAGAYYAKALAWAKSAGIADSVEGNLFGPVQPLTRQDAFTFTYRALRLLGKRYTDGTAEDLAGFPDADMLDEYAVIPTATLIDLGIVNGMNGKLSPQSTLTRAQMAKVLAIVLQLP